jgi:parvulin-like peptidyl-prolyl isomerase
LEISAKATAEKREAARARAETIRGEALQANDEKFKQLALQHSCDQSTRYIGGDTGWLNARTSENRWPAEVIAAASALKSPGDVAPVIETADNFFIIRLSERREAAARPLSEVADVIRYQLLQSRFQQRNETFARELTNGLAIHVNREALSKVKMISNTKPPVPPALPD